MSLDKSGGFCSITTTIQLNENYQTAISDMRAYSSQNDPEALLLRAEIFFVSIQQDLKHVSAEGVSNVLHIAGQAAIMVIDVMQNCDFANHTDVVNAERTAHKFRSLNKS